MIFTSVVDLDIEDYPAFLLTGLVAWSWFSSGLSDGTGSLIAHRHLLFRPRCPAAVLPVAAAAVALVDAVIALPVVIAIVAINGDLAPSILFLPVLAVIHGDALRHVLQRRAQQGGLATMLVIATVGDVRCHNSPSPSVPDLPRLQGQQNSRHVVEGR